MGVAKESGASQKYRYGYRRSRKHEIAAGYRRTPAEPKSNAKVPECKHLPPSWEREEHTMKVPLYKTTEKITKSCLVTYTFKVPITL